MSVSTDYGSPVTQYRVSLNGGAETLVPATGSSPTWVTDYDIGEPANGSQYVVRAESSGRIGSTTAATRGLIVQGDLTTEDGLDLTTEDALVLTTE